MLVIFRISVHDLLFTFTVSVVVPNRGAPLQKNVLIYLPIVLNNGKISLAANWYPL